MTVKNKISILFGTIKRITIVPLVVLIIVLISSSIPKTKDKIWEDQLNEMNYLIIRTSSINIINGLNLTIDQAKALKKLSKKVDKLNIQYPDTINILNKDLNKISRTYNKLIRYLLEQKTIPETFKNEVFSMRLLESDIIKRTVLAAQRPGIKGKNCIRCHALPKYFPQGDIANKETNAIPPWKRKIIDLAHIKGIFNDNGTKLLWELKTSVDSILTDGQKYMMNDFRCGLLPVNDLANPTNIGQAFSKNEWTKYFEDIRKLHEDDWNDFKALYFLPLEDVINATLPGIKTHYRKKMILKIKKIVEKVRKMDKIDFELQKETLCTQLNDALKVDFLNGESSRKKTERQFLSTVYLLFPGSNEIYDQIIKNQSVQND